MRFDFFIETRQAPHICQLYCHQMKRSLALLASACLTLATTLAAPVELKLDLTKTNTPISPYIYGQFVEHLGRCIYGGIWAQLLEDRKFYFSITAAYSPYQLGRAH